MYTTSFDILYCHFYSICILISLVISYLNHKSFINLFFKLIFRSFQRIFLLFISDLVWIWLRTLFVIFHYFKIIKSCLWTFRTWFLWENAYVYLREMLFGMFYKYQLGQLLIIIFVSFICWPTFDLILYIENGMLKCLAIIMALLIFLAVFLVFIMKTIIKCINF